MRLMRRSPGAAAIAIAGLGVIVIAIGVWLPWHSPWPAPDGYQALRIGVVALVTGLWLAAALLAHRRDPAGPLWKILFAYVLADWIWVLGFLGNPLAWTIGDTFSPGIATAVFVHAVVAFPSGRLNGRLDRTLVPMVYVLALATALLAEMTWDVSFTCDPFCNRNAFFVWKNDALHDGIRAFNTLSIPIVGLVVVAAVVRHWRAAGPAMRRALLPAVAVLPFAYAAYIIAFVGDNTDVAWLSDLGRTPIALAIDAIPPIGLILGITRTRLGRGRTVDLLLELGRGIPTGQLQGSLARALGDSSLQLAFAAPDGSGFVDPNGRPFELPVDDRRRAVSTLDRDGRTVALLIHDPALDADDPGMVEAVGSVAALALENERLSAQVRAQLEEVRASRQRIVEAGDAERRRVERNLHDGAQQRLVALAMRLDSARGTAIDAQSLIDQATSELGLAIEEVRRLARGIHPTILSEAGLQAAVEALAERTPVPVEIEVDDARYPEPVEAAAYFVVAEALTNVARHGVATHATVRTRVAADVLTVEVVDDGRGGADAGRGSGLRGLGDRVAAIGGSLEVISPEGGGTTVRARLPLDDAR
jgi:signal transduction histidine kinase